jgi:hypothetical protein
MLGGLAAGFAWVLGDKSYELVSHTFPGLLSYSSLPLGECSKLILTTSLAWGEHKPAQFASWMLWPVLPSLIAGVSAGVWGYKSSIIKPVIQRSGPKLLPAWEIPAAKDIKKVDPPGIKIGENITLSQTELVQSIGIVGKIGSGKTVLLFPVVEQIVERGEDCLMLLDYKQDFVQTFGSNCYQIAPWNPSAENGVKWQIGRDVLNEADAESFSAALIKESDDPIWSQAARGITEGIILELQKIHGTNWGWSELAESLKNLLADTKKLAAAIAEHRPLIAARITEMSSETRESVFFNIVTFGQQILSIAKAEESIIDPLSWSVSEWVAGEKPRVILGWRAESEIMSRRIILPIIKTAIQRLLSQPDRKPHEMSYNFVLDEIAQLGEVPGLTQGLTALRSKNARFWLGWQSFAQIKAIYKDLWPTFVTETMFLGKLVNADDQEDAADICGHGLFDRLHITNSAGGISQTTQRAEEYIYRPERFLNLGRCDTGVKFAFVSASRKCISEVILKFPDPKKIKLKFTKDD